MKAAVAIRSTTRTIAGIFNAPRHARVSWLYVKGLHSTGKQERTI